MSLSDFNLPPGKCQGDVRSVAGRGQHLAAKVHASPFGKGRLGPQYLTGKGYNVYPKKITHRFFVMLTFTFRTMNLFHWWQTRADDSNEGPSRRRKIFRKMCLRKIIKRCSTTHI